MELLAYATLDNIRPDHAINWNTRNLFSFVVRKDAQNCLRGGAKRKFGEGLNEISKLCQEKQKLWEDAAVRAAFTDRMIQLRQEVLEKHPELYMPPAEEVPRPVVMVSCGDEIGTLYNHCTPFANLIQTRRCDPSLFIHFEDPDPTDETYADFKERYPENEECPSKDDFLKIMQTVKWRNKDEDFVIPKGAPVISIPE